MNANYNNVPAVEMAVANWPAGIVYAGSQKVVAFVAPSGSMETRILERREYPALDAYALGGKLRPLPMAEKIAALRAHFGK